MTPINRAALFCLALLVIGFAPTGVRSADPIGCDTTSDMMLVSVKTGGEPVSDLGSGHAGHAISNDARYIVFGSRDSTIVPNDGNDAFDVFLHDRETCTTTLISRNPSGIPGTGGGGFSSQSFISEDGRYILFDSGHSDLVPNDNAGKNDVFLHDRETQVVTRVSNGLNGEEANASSDATGMSKNGRFILFGSDAENLVPNDTNGTYEAFLFDRELNTIELLSVNNDGVAANSWSTALDVSDDGRFVVFISFASNLSSLDTTFRQKAFLRDRVEGVTTLVSVNSAGEPLNGTLGTIFTFLSNDTQSIGLIADATNIDPNDTNEGVDSYLSNRLTGEVTWVTPRTGDTIYFAHAWDISDDNRYVAVESASPMDGVDLNDATDIFLYDRQTQLMMLQSRTPSGTASNGFSFFARLTPDGQYTLFQSSATDLISNTPENQANLYLARFIPPRGSLDIATMLQGRPSTPHPDWVTSIRVVIVPHGSTTPVYDEFIETDENGQFAIPELNYGIYTVWIKGTNTLATSPTITLAAESLNMNTGMLRAGDANGDNVINLVDFSLLAATFGMQDGETGYDSRADFNGDDQITLPDFSLLASNFDTAGETLAE